MVLIQKILYMQKVVKGEKESRTPVEDGLQIQKILNGLYESAATGKEVEI